MASMPQMNKDGFIFLLFLIGVEVIAGTIMRIYLMRRKSGSWAAKTSHIILIFYAISVIVSGVILVRATLIEKNLLLRHSEDELPKYLLSEPFLKVREKRYRF
jgi:Kef-type K+ transport system membrane component KefB